MRSFVGSGNIFRALYFGHISYAQKSWVKPIYSVVSTTFAVEPFANAVLYPGFFRYGLTYYANIFPMAISKQKTALFFRLSISVTVFGALFKFISWPLILIGATGTIVFHSIQFYQKQDRTSLDYARHLLIFSFSCNYIFSLLHLPHDYVPTLLTKAALTIFVLLYCKEIIALLLENAQNGLLPQKIGTENLATILSDLATVYIVIASLFKILHWEFGIINANLLLVIGLFTALISILASSKYIGS